MFVYVHSRSDSSSHHGDQKRLLYNEHSGYSKSYSAVTVTERITKSTPKIVSLQDRGILYPLEIGPVDGWKEFGEVSVYM